MATSTPLMLPTAVAFDSSGNLYVAETARHVVRRIDAEGKMTTVAGTGVQGFDGDGGAATVALLDSPQGLAVDAAGNLLIADTHNHRVRRVDVTSGVIATIVGGGSGGDGGAGTAAKLDLPIALAVDGKGNLYIADAGSHRIRRVDGAGKIATVVGTDVQGFAGDGGGAAAALIDSPGGIAVDGAGNLLVADTHNQRVRRIDVTTGVITTVAGNGAAGFADATSAASSRLALPRGISVDAQGNVYVADVANHRIRRVDGAKGAISTVAGDGTQGFAGDGGPATSASFDSPGGAAVSAAGVLAIADTGNARVREIASGAQVGTVGGQEGISPSALTLTGPSSITYGAGQIVVTVSGSGASGSVTFYDSYSGATSSATAALIGNSATLDASALAAGVHRITAVYGGDATHAMTQSAVFPLTVNPAAVTATVVPGSSVYGQTVPALSGSLSGVLVRDQGSVSASFSTTTSALSPAGSYPVTVTLAGAAAVNYVLASAPSFVVTKAATVTTLATNAATVGAGQMVTFTAHVASATAGTPTGAVMIFDGGTALGTATANAAGDAVFATSTLAAGSHNVTAVYGGDGNFNGSSSSAQFIVIVGPSGPTADFTLAASGTASQTVVAGSSANFMFTVQPQNGLASQVSLAASGLPKLATAAFNPPYVPPGNSPMTVTMTIGTPRAALMMQRSLWSPVYALVFSPFVAVLLRRRGRRVVGLLGIVLLAPLVMMTGCGDRVYTANYAALSKSYTITVTGTATGPSGVAIQHAATVTLVVTSAN